MPQRMSLKQLDQFLGTNRQKVDAIGQELNQVQTGFVSAYQVSKGQHDATLKDLTLRAAYDLKALPQEIQRAIDDRVVVERKTLQDRRKELADTVVPKAQQIADGLLAKAQAETAKMRDMNPRLNQQEEQLKADRAQMEAQLNQLNAEIKRRSGCLTMFINYFKINDLDRQRHKLLGRMEENAKALQAVRDEWAKAKAAYTTDETQYEYQWEQANLDAARVRDELDQLNDDAKLQELALQRAIFYVFDNWKQPLTGGGSDLIKEINQMVQLNVETDDYTEGLGKVAGLIALMNGISQGLQSVDTSVEALVKEQEMHAAYLKPVEVTVADDAIAFHRQWDGLRDKVKDENALAQHPKQFSALFDEETKGPLTEAGIKQMFDSLSQSLTAATRGWKG